MLLIECSLLKERKKLNELVRFKMQILVKNITKILVVDFVLLASGPPSNHKGHGFPSVEMDKILRHHY